MHDTTSELTATHTPFFIQGIEWDFSGDDSEDECDNDDHDLPRDMILWLDKDSIAEIEDDDGEPDEGELADMIVDNISDDYGWCINGIEDWREIDPAEVEELLAA